jgi:hypothetical protein
MCLETADRGVAGVKTLTESIYWNSPDDILASTDGGQLRFPGLLPPGMRSLAGTGLESVLNIMMLLRDETGKVIGSGSELEVLPGRGSPGPRDVYLTIVLPGRGSLFVHQRKNMVDPRRAEIWKLVEETGQPWEGELSIVSTVGPGPDGRAIVLAGTDEFAGVTGTMFQTSIMRRVEVNGYSNTVCEKFELEWPREAAIGVNAYPGTREEVTGGP